MSKMSMAEIFLSRLSGVFCIAWAVAMLAGMVWGIPAWAQQAVAPTEVPGGWKRSLDLFLQTKIGQYILIAVFFFVIIGYLRLLFGPKGFLREKEWDEQAPNDPPTKRTGASLHRDHD